MINGHPYYTVKSLASRRGYAVRYNNGQGESFTSKKFDSEIKASSYCRGLNEQLKKTGRSIELADIAVPSSIETTDDYSRHGKLFGSTCGFTLVRDEHYFYCH